MYTGGTPEAHRRYTGESVVHPVYLRCTPVYTARRAGESGGSVRNEPEVCGFAEGLQPRHNRYSPFHRSRNPPRCSVTPPLCRRLTLHQTQHPQTFHHCHQMPRVASRCHFSQKNWLTTPAYSAPAPPAEQALHGAWGWVDVALMQGKYSSAVGTCSDIHPSWGISRPA